MPTTVSVDVPYRGVQRAQWTGLVGDDTGDIADMGRFRFWLTAQITGTFDGETVSLEGSLDGSTFVPLTVDGSTALEATADGIFHIYERVSFIRPVVSLDDGVVDVDVRVEGLAIT